jgi:hypothetical protein
MSRVLSVIARAWFAFALVWIGCQLLMPPWLLVMAWLPRGWEWSGVVALLVTWAVLLWRYVPRVYRWLGRFRSWRESEPQPAPPPPTTVVPAEADEAEVDDADAWRGLRFYA